MDTAPPCAFVIFGATGDLAARKLFPALYQLHGSKALHPDTAIIGYGRSDLTDEQLRARLEEAVKRFNGSFSKRKWKTFTPRISYVRGSYNQREGFDQLHERLSELKLHNHLFYTATPPETYEGIALRLGAAELNKSSGWTRLVIEKPFGHDLQSAQALNRTVLGSFEENQIYRIDHYLAKETAQNLAVLRFANTLFEPTWNSRYIDHVQITMAEPMGMEGRGSFYEEAGVIRDVFQNHLLQLAALVAMEPPARYDALSVRDEKVKVLHAMTCIEPEKAVMGQYIASEGAASKRLDGYRQEPAVAPDSLQATFAAVQFGIANWRWSGVPFFVRAGKRLEVKASEIVLHFKRPPHTPFTLTEKLKPDRLVLRVVPNEGITLRFNSKTPGQGIELARISMKFAYDEHFDRPNPDAYETLLHDAMVGDATLFQRADEVEAQWQVVQPLLEHWDRGDKEPEFYLAGSRGPKAATEMLTKQGRYWHLPGKD